MERLIEMLWVAEVVKLHLTAGFGQPEMISVLAGNHGGIASIWRLNTTVLKIANERMKNHTSLRWCWDTTPVTINASEAVA